MRSHREGIRKLGDALAEHDAAYNTLTFVHDHVTPATAESEVAGGGTNTGRQRRPSIVYRSVDLLWLSSKIDKFQSRSWWAGSFLILMRIMQTSIMVFIANPGLRATAASLVALIGVAVQTHTAPYRRASDNHAALAAAWLLFVWSFSLLARYSGAVDGEHGVVLGATLITATVGMMVFVMCALATDVKKYGMDDERELPPDDVGIELGVLPSVTEGAQTESNEETSESIAMGNESPDQKPHGRTELLPSSSASPWSSILSIDGGALCGAETTGTVSDDALTATGQPSFDELASLAIAAGVDRSEVSRLALALSKQSSPPVTRDAI